MAKQTKQTSAPRPEPTNRWATVLTGVLIGALWGAVMWAINAAIHGSWSGVVFTYLVLTMAMLGGGVAAFFGAVWVRRSGENVGPSFRRRK